MPWKQKKLILPIYSISTFTQLLEQNVCWLNASIRQWNVQFGKCTLWGRSSQLELRVWSAFCLPKHLTQNDVFFWHCMKLNSFDELIFLQFNNIAIRILEVCLLCISMGVHSCYFPSVVKLRCVVLTTDRSIPFRHCNYPLWRAAMFVTCQPYQSS